MKKSDFFRVFLPLFIIVGAIFCLDNGVVVHKLPDLQNEPDSIILFHVISLFTFGAKDFGAPEVESTFISNRTSIPWIVEPLGMEAKL